MNAATRFVKASNKARHADAAFVKAIKEQFGQDANRYDYPVSEYNVQTMTARNLKIDADKELHIALGAMREAGLTINDAEQIYSVDCFLHEEVHAQGVGFTNYLMRFAIAAIPESACQIVSAKLQEQGIKIKRIEAKLALKQDINLYAFPENIIGA